MLDYRSVVRTPLLRESPLNRYRSGARLRRLRRSHANLIIEGEDAFAFVFGPITAQELFDLAAGFFEERQSFEVVIESETGAIVEDFLLSEGWTCVEEEIAMVLSPPSSEFDPPESLEIVPVGTAATYEDYMSVVPGNRAWIPSLAAATDRQVGLYVGYASGVPVATARQTCYGEVAEITAVQTQPDYRRRGYGRAMTGAAITDARDRGCRHIMLTATEMGYPLYLKMGFQEVCSYRIYESP